MHAAQLGLQQPTGRAQRAKRRQMLKGTVGRRMHAAQLGLQQPAAHRPLAARSAPNGGRCSSPDRAAQLPHGRADAESRRQAAPLLCLREGAATTND